MRTPLGADRRLALQKLPGAVTVLQSKIGQAKRMLSNNSTTKTRSRRPLGAEEIALIEYRSQIAFDHEIRAVDYRYAEMGPDLDNARWLRDGFSGKLPDEMLNRLVGRRIERHQLAGNTEVELGTAEWRTLAQAICVASYEAMARQAERDDGEFNGQPIHPMLVKALLRVDSAKNDGVTFDEVINAEISRRGSGKHAKALPERTERKFRIASRSFPGFEVPIMQTP